MLAHRGLWSQNCPPNSPEALARAAEAGFGVETDLRDAEGTIVISHDPPRHDMPDADMVLGQVARASTAPITFALNVKADGLVPMLDRILDALRPHEGFFFDMSVPQLLAYNEHHLPVAVRVSEYEEFRPALFQDLNIRPRIWLDAFHSDWWLDDPALADMTDMCQVVVVSSEIHGRDPRRVWKWFLESFQRGDDVYLCTDVPQDLAKLIV